jgi:hypothetical protein
MPLAAADISEMAGMGLENSNATSATFGATNVSSLLICTFKPPAGVFLAE